jgi:hypothetical protein
LDKYDRKFHSINATHHRIAKLFRGAGRFFLGGTKKVKAFYGVPRGTFLRKVRKRKKYAIYAGSCRFLYSSLLI